MRDEHYSLSFQILADILNYFESFQASIKASLATLEGSWKYILKDEQIPFSKRNFSFDVLIVFHVNKQVLPFLFSINVVILFHQPIHFAKIKPRKHLSLLFQRRAEIADFRKHLCQLRQDNEVLGLQLITLYNDVCCFQSSCKGRYEDNIDLLDWTFNTYSLFPSLVAQRTVNQRLIKLQAFLTLFTPKCIVWKVLGKSIELRLSVADHHSFYETSLNIVVTVEALLSETAVSLQIIATNLTVFHANW